MRSLRKTSLSLLCLLLGGCSLFRGRGERPAYRKLSPAVAYELMRDSPEMMILDLRPAREFIGDTGHVRRALNVPLERLPYRVQDFAGFRDETFLVYCGSRECSEQGMALLLSSGFENAVLMDGGIDAWIEQGFKTVLPDDVLGRSRMTTGGERRIMPERPGERPERGDPDDLPIEAPPPP